MHPFEEKLLLSWPPERWKDLTVLLAVSGGADSVALLRAMVAVRQGGAGRLIVAHLNHGLRGAESDADDAFVAELAGALGCSVKIGRNSIASHASERTGVEEAAREARYEFLQRAAEEEGARYVALAHTANDQAETILHRIVRGTGIAGLTGMPRVRPLGPAVTVIRPLLSFMRAEVEEYLQQLGQPFRNDASNLDSRFTRNRLRHEVLPWLAREFNPHVSEALLRLGSLAGEIQSVVDRQVVRVFEHAVTSRPPHSVAVQCRKLAGLDRYTVRELFVAIWRCQSWPQQSMTRPHWDELADIALADVEPRMGRTKMFPGAVQAQKQGEQLSLTRLVNEQACERV